MPTEDLMNSSFQNENSKSQISIDKSFSYIESFSTNNESIKIETKSASFFSLTLYSLQWSTQSPLETFNELISKTGKKSNNISTGAIVGIVCGIIVLLISAILVIIFIKKNKNKNCKQKHESMPSSSPKTKETQSAKSIDTFVDSDEIDIDFWI